MTEEFESPSEKPPLHQRAKRQLFGKPRVTFSLSMFGMAHSYFKKRREAWLWKRRLALFSVGFLLCVTILAIISIEKFTEGGWITLAVTGGLVALCFVIRSHYRTVGIKLGELCDQLGSLPVDVDRIPAEPDPAKLR